MNERRIGRFINERTALMLACAAFAAGCAETESSGDQTYEYDGSVLNINPSPETGKENLRTGSYTWKVVNGDVKIIYTHYCTAPIDNDADPSKRTVLAEREEINDGPFHITNDTVRIEENDVCLDEIVTKEEHKSLS